MGGELQREDDAAAVTRRSLSPHPRNRDYDAAINNGWGTPEMNGGKRRETCLIWKVGMNYDCEHIIIRFQRIWVLLQSPNNIQNRIRHALE